VSDVGSPRQAEKEKLVFKEPSDNEQSSSQNRCGVKTALRNEGPQKSILGQEQPSEVCNQ